MQITPADVVNGTLAQATGTVNVRVLAGNLTAIPRGALFQATVTQVNTRDAKIIAYGQTLTIKPHAGLEVGDALFVRVSNSANGTLEIAASPHTPRARPSLATPAELGQVRVVEVLATLPDGRVHANIDGQEQIATPSEPLAPGGRFVLEVTRTPSGMTLRPATERSGLPLEVATAILRFAPAPDVAAVLKPLQAELKALAQGQPVKGVAPVPSGLRAVATTVLTSLASLVPSEPRVLAAPELQRLVSNGGIQFEAKLARLVGEPVTAGTARAPNILTGPSTSVATVPVESLLKPGVAVTAIGNPAGVTETPTTLKPGIATDPNAELVRDTVGRVTLGVGFTVTSEPEGAAQDPPQPVASYGSRAQVHSALRGDLKGDLLRLLQSAQDLGVASRLPAVRAAIVGIESQQATQTFAQATRSAYILQVPFPDGGEWRTLHLSVEREETPNQADLECAGHFRMLLHVTLSELGDTWIDAALSGHSFRAAIYINRAEVRERVATALPELRDGLQADGLSEVLLDVRPSSALPASAKRQSAAMTAGRPASVSLLDLRA